MDTVELTQTGSTALPDWAQDMVDLHVHAAPSLLPRHGNDAQMVAAERALGFSTVVLKSHEGSTVERAAAVGDGVYGGIVLNSPVGGANPDAVEVAARLGGRMVWMPTVSSAAHKAGATNPELNVHKGFELRLVEVFDGDRLRREWLDILDIVAQHDLVLASGHLSTDETGPACSPKPPSVAINRLLVNHPMMPFLGWHDAGRRRPAQARRTPGTRHPAGPARTGRPAPAWNCSTSTRTNCWCSAATWDTRTTRPPPRPSRTGCRNWRSGSGRTPPTRS